MIFDTESKINTIIAQAVLVTETYKQHINDHVAIREAMCLKKQYPELLSEIRSYDLFAGRKAPDRLTYVGSIWWGSYPGIDGKMVAGKQGGYCFDFSAIERLAGSDEEKKLLEELSNFWANETTVNKVYKNWDEELKQYAGNNGQISAPNIGFSLAVNLDKLMQRGIPGLLEDVGNKKHFAELNNGDVHFYQGLQIAIDVLVDVCRFYEKQAQDLATRSESPEDKQRLEAISQTLAAIVCRPPQSFREVIQLAWIYILISGGKHLEAWGLDIALGDFYAQDVDNGRICEEEATEMLLSLWRLFNEDGEAATCRIGVGGKGRRNEINADRFALAAMRTTKIHKQVTPQLMLRFYKGQNPLLLKEAYDTISESYTYPVLYNDDAIIPGVAEIFGVSEEQAQRYHPLGCGEYMLAGLSPSMLDINWNIVKALEAALHNGADTKGNIIGPQTGTLDALDTFEKLYDAFRNQISFAAGISAKAYQCIREIFKKECSFLYASLLTDDCLERGRSAFDGGMRYIGACAMGHGFTNAADSLTAIKKLVYEEKRLSLEQLVEALDTDFKGQEALRKMLLDCPKYGNNNEDADKMLILVYKYVNLAAKEAGRRVGLDFHTASSVNPGGYGMGFGTGATADGRRKGQPFAIGNSPTSGFEKNGLTALLSSVAKVDPANGGAVTNIKISREFFTEERGKLDALFNTFFLKGGMQANISVVSRNDLETALEEPEKFPHLLVRVGGWTARFTDLERKIQEDIIRRTLF